MAFFKLLPTAVLLVIGVPSAEWRRHSFFRADAILPKGHDRSSQRPLRPYLDQLPVSSNRGPVIVKDTEYSIVLRFV